MRKYYLRLIRTVWHHSWGAADFVAGLIDVFGPPIFAYLGIENRDKILGTLAWQIPCTVLAVLFVFRLILAPYWVHAEEEKERKEVEKERDRLAEQLDDRARKRLARDTIEILLDHAEKMKARAISTQDEFEAWCKDLDDWYKTAQTELSERMSRADQAYFVNISPMAAVIHGCFNKEHNNLRLHLDCWVENLMRLMEKLPV